MHTIPPDKFAERTGAGGNSVRPAPAYSLFRFRVGCYYAGHTTSVSSGYFSLIAVSKFAFAVSSSTFPVK